MFPDTFVAGAAHLNRSASHYKGIDFMLRSLFSLVLFPLLFAASSAFAVFSEFVSVSPANETKHQNMKPIIKVEGSLVTIQLPYRDGPWKYWLVVSDKPLTKDKQDFRNINISLGLPARTDIVLIAPLAPSFDGQFSREMKDRKLEIRLNLSRELAQRAYIYHDFPGLVLDGGYYYTVDIPSYMLKKESQ